MRWLSPTLPLGVLTLLVGCAGLETYPAAVPTPEQVQARLDWRPPVECYVPPEVITALAHTALGPGRVPTPEEWSQWLMKGPAPVQKCTGKGRKRRCTPAPVTAVDQANQQALVQPTSVHTDGGQSGRIRFDYDLNGTKIYRIITSPSETTWLQLPEGLRLAADLLIDDGTWEVGYSTRGEDRKVQHIIALRPLYPGLKTRGILQVRNGANIQLALESQERPGMLAVTWVLPGPPALPRPTPDQVPPVFDKAVAYANYRFKVESPSGPPPWMPEAVVDDGKSTLIKLPPGMEAMRVPIVSGIQQNGDPALVASRLYIKAEHGYWIWVQNIWSALELRDGAGIKVRAVRQTPPPITKEVRYETPAVPGVDRPRPVSLPGRLGRGPVRQ